MRLLLYLLAALGLLMLAATFTPLVPWYARVLSGNWSDEKGAVLILLGGGTIDREMLSDSSYWRAVYGVRAWNQGGYREVLISGQGVAPLMRDFLVCHGVPAAAIRLEERSTSTRENAIEAARLLASTPGAKVLLTSDYHMYRAWRAFRKAGLDTIPHPFPDVLKASSRFENRWPMFLRVSKETAKIAYYRLRGWI
jgi:uncharacterized SAM-binding protein YcdF (DUF218 family)